MSGRRHATLYPRERPIVQEAGWAPGPVWTGAENLALSGFDPRTVQLVASCYTDYATRPEWLEWKQNYPTVHDWKLHRKCM
jgi:hypothetical protein